MDRQDARVEMPETRYALTSDGVHIAYQLFGEGPHDIVFMNSAFISNVEIGWEYDVAGIGVAIGARVGALAGPGDVLVSQTVKDLVAGSGLAFDAAGEHELKGVPDRWRVYRVTR